MWHHWKSLENYIFRMCKWLKLPLGRLVAGFLKSASRHERKKGGGLKSSASLSQEKQHDLSAINHFISSHLPSLEPLPDIHFQTPDDCSSDLNILGHFNIKKKKKKNTHYFLEREFHHYSNYSMTYIQTRGYAASAAVFCGEQIVTDTHFGQLCWQ